MKTKFFKIVISFIFLILIYSSIVYANTNDEYIGCLCIDSPQAGNSYIKPDNMQIKLMGWAVSNDSNANVKLFFDENPVTVIRTSRPDVDTIVSPQYGGIANTPKAGFESNIDISNVSPGNHTITVEEVSRTGRVISFRNIKCQYSK